MTNNYDYSCNTNPIDTANILSDVLVECKSAAANGYRIASKHEKKLNKALKTAEETVRSTLLRFTNSPCYSPDATSLLQGQLLDIEQAFARLSFMFKEDLEDLHNNLSKFSITLFGRTMAGKSTLMEILTEGNGDSIGKGSQRTTRDVRKYSWNNLEITDVPGIGAFEGEEDEQIAFHAAKTADLILFLITDDGPQSNEAECFSRILALGKPVVCVVNVKSAMPEGRSIKLITRDIDRKFDNQRLGDIRQQFLEYADQFGQSWNHVPFIYVHLKSAFAAQREQNEEYAKIYYQISRIDYLKKRIVEIVRAKGRFLRIKTFVDIITNPMLESMEQLLDQSQINSVQGRTILTKKRQLIEWRESFYRDSRSRIASTLVQIKSDLSSEISEFAEEHFSDKDADKAWLKILKGRRIETRCQELMHDVEVRVNNKLREFSRELTSELRFSISFSSDKSLKMRAVFDSKKMWDWSSLVLGGGLSIAAGIAYLLGAAIAGPLGWAALAVGGIGTIGSFFFKSRNQRELEARSKLERNLRDHVSKICESLEAQMIKQLDSLVSVRINDLLKEIDKINSVIFSLADTQRDLAWDLNGHLLSLNRDVLVEAMRIVGADEYAPNVQLVARIPGNTSVLLLKDGTVFSREKHDALYKLMAERIGFVFETDDKKVLISRVIGKLVDRKTIKIEEKLGVAHIPIPEETPVLLNRIRLAQQASSIQIIKQ